MRENCDIILSVNEMKRIIVASDSFKGSLSSREIVDIFDEVAKKHKYSVEIIGVEIADGGEGTIDAILADGKFQERRAECLGPLFRPVRARYAIYNDVAIVESAQSSGLTLIDFKEGNASITTTYGTGEVIRSAILEGAKRIYVCVGGSATNDGGIGALSALGFDFLDKDGNKLKPIGANLGKIADVNMDNEVTSGVEFVVIADVDNPLIGERGATKYYARQKGATDKDVEMLEEGMRNFADVTECVTGVSLHNKIGAGAAGGLAGGLMAYLGASIQSGIESVLALIDFKSQAQDADAIITGEGKIDVQSLCGKAVGGVCRLAQGLSIPVYAIAGCCALKEQKYNLLGIRRVETLIDDSISQEDSILNARRHAFNVADKLLKYISESE